MPWHRVSSSGHWPRCLPILLRKLRPSMLNPSRLLEQPRKRLDGWAMKTLKCCAHFSESWPRNRVVVFSSFLSIILKKLFEQKTVCCPAPSLAAHNNPPVAAVADVGWVVGKVDVPPLANPPLLCHGAKNHASKPKDHFWKAALLGWVETPACTQNNRFHPQSSTEAAFQMG